jgi:hypothetical protein
MPQPRRLLHRSVTSPSMHTSIVGANLPFPASMHGRDQTSNRDRSLADTLLQGYRRRPPKYEVIGTDHMKRVGRTRELPCMLLRRLLCMVPWAISQVCANGIESPIFRAAGREVM